MKYTSDETDVRKGGAYFFIYGCVQSERLLLITVERMWALRPWGFARIRPHSQQLQKQQHRAVNGRKHSPPAPFVAHFNSCSLQLRCWS